MTHQVPPGHFQGLSVSEHLKMARKKGVIASEELHGSELPGHLAAGAETAKEMAVGLLFLWILGSTLFPLLLFAIAWTLWETGRFALAGWAKLERLHHLIEEERWEIEHHRDQEKEELQALYEAKGFQGKLLDEVVDVLMADDNRLLKVMLEEEIGVSLEVYEHPLKQALGAALGALASATLLLIGQNFWPSWGIPLLSFLNIGTAAYLSALFEKRSPLPALIWNISLALFCAGSLYFALKLL
jgi:vacuolar iron transporter family protein